MIKLEGGIKLPNPPSNAKGFKRPDDVAERRWKAMKPDMWQRAYTHCLFALHSMFESPLHMIVPNLSRKMLEASDPFVVALRFIGEMELQGYVKYHVRQQSGDMSTQERLVIPTRKLLTLKLRDEAAPESVIIMPSVVGEEYLSRKIAVRGGIRSHENIKVAAVTRDMADERFVVNEFVLKLIQDYPPNVDGEGKITKDYMLGRMLNSVEKLRGKVFRFPQFLDSRSRMYDATTAGLSPQGADHEKAVLLPVYAERLTDSGFDALCEAACGYSEMDWDFRKMMSHAVNPEKWKHEWLVVDKPYCYMACAKLILEYVDNPEKPLPAFIPLDGRCSGLQHWSAVIRSNAITRHLGMHVDEHELDIYERIAKEWQDSLAFDDKHYATRKAAKIPVMTWGYSATQMTSMEHMAKLFGEETAWSDAAEGYVVVKDGLSRARTGELGRDLYQRLNEILGPLTAAVKWVCDCATIISKAGNVDITWVTPDGFTGKQRKVLGIRLVVNVTLSNKEREYVEIQDFSGNVPDTKRHRSAIAPNIIHSLDATHLRMVARRLKLLGSPMIFIHDSFATHCNMRGPLYREIVDTFISLYSGNYLADLEKYWTETYDVDLPEIPTMGDWEPESLRELKNFFM